MLHKRTFNEAFIKLCESIYTIVKYMMIKMTLHSLVTNIIKESWEN